MDQFDIIIAGGGLSGLSLACHLARSPFAGRSTLIVDASFKERADRTWAFWSNRPGAFDAAVSGSWNKMHFAGRDFQGVIDLGDYRYQVVQGIDFFKRVRAELAACPNIHFRHGRVEEIHDGPEVAQVIVDGLPISGRWVFDGRGQPKRPEASVGQTHSLNMHFFGWEIVTAEPVFDPGVATLMDFRVPQDGATRFFYLLPYSERKALVEFTIFSAAALPRSDYENGLHNYLTKTLGSGHYEIERRESGCLPLTDRPYPRRLGRRVMAIGLRGGRLKPSSGYAFTRIQRDSAAIAHSLSTRGHPFNVPIDPQRYRLSDSLLLEIMGEHGDEIESIFCALFKNNPGERIIRFLDQDAGLWEQLRIIPTLPPRLFIATLLRRAFRPVNNRPGKEPDHRNIAEEF